MQCILKVYVLITHTAPGATIFIGKIKQFLQLETLFDGADTQVVDSTLIRLELSQACLMTD